MTDFDTRLREARATRRRNPDPRPQPVAKPLDDRATPERDTLLAAHPLMVGSARSRSEHPIPSKLSRARSGDFAGTAYGERCDQISRQSDAGKTDG